MTSTPGFVYTVPGGGSGGGGVVGPVPHFINGVSQAKFNGAGPVSVGNPAGGNADCIMFAIAAANVAVELPASWVPLDAGVAGTMHYAFAWAVSDVANLDNDWNPSTASGLTMTVLECAWKPVTGIARLGATGKSASTVTPTAPGLTTPGSPELALMLMAGQPGGFFDEMSPPPSFTVVDFVYPDKQYAATFAQRNLNRLTSLGNQVGSMPDPGPAACCLVLLNNGFGYA